MLDNHMTHTTFIRLTGKDPAPFGAPRQPGTAGVLRTPRSSMGVALSWWGDRALCFLAVGCMPQFLLLRAVENLSTYLGLF